MRNFRGSWNLEILNLLFYQKSGASLHKSSWFRFFYNDAVSLTNVLKIVKIDVFSHLLLFFPTFRYARNLETLNLVLLRIYWSYNLLCEPIVETICTLSNRRIFTSYIVVKYLTTVFDQSASVSIISKIKSWNFKRNTTNLLFFFLFVSSYYLRY